MKKPYVVILGKSTGEANTYARRAGLQRGAYRFASSASAVSGLRVADIHELPTFAGRRDKHAINAKLRFVRGERISVEMPPAPEQPPVDQGDGMGEQLTIDDALASNMLEATSRPAPDVSEARAREILDGPPPAPLNIEDFVEVSRPEESHGEETGAPEPSEDAAPAPRSKRRSRCAGCGELVLKSEHVCAEPEPARPEPVAAPAPAPVEFDFAEHTFDPAATPPSEYDLARMFD